MSSRRTAAGGAAAGGVSTALVVLLAFTAGAAVANIYYIQPLLNVVARDLGVSDTAAGLLVTCSQLGYVAGLALLVPLGDLRERRTLISTVLAGAAVALAVCAAAPSFAVLGIGLLAAGALSVVAQIVVPLAATLAADTERGHVVGRVVAGLLIGILSARILSGLIGRLGGWRLVFGLAAVAMLALALALRRALPEVAPTERVRYRAALRSVLSLVREEPVLRQRMALGTCQMAGFSVLWTSIAFLLGGPPFHFGEAVIGLFGLAGVAGALMAPRAGRLADRGRGRLALTLFLSVVTASWGLLALGSRSVVVLIVGIVVLDLGIQGAQITNQSTIYALRPEARSRVNTAYMVSVFVGGTIGSLLSATVWGAAGWSGVCAVGAGIAALALAIWGATEWLGRRGGERMVLAASGRAD